MLDRCIQGTFTALESPHELLTQDNCISSYQPDLAVDILSQSDSQFVFSETARGIASGQNHSETKTFNPVPGHRG